MSTDGSTESKRPGPPQPTKSKGLKRKHPAVFNGEKAMSIDTGIACPICFNLIDSPYMTECGHSFCLACIKTSLEQHNICPKCNTPVSQGRLFPNVTLNAIVAKHKSQLSTRHKAGGRTSLLENMCDIINDSTDSNDLTSYHDITSMIDLLKQKQQNLLLETQMGQAYLTLEFLNQIKAVKEEKLTVLQRELAVIGKDMDTVSTKTSMLEMQYNKNKQSSSLTNSATDTKSASDTCSDNKNLVKLTSPIVRQRISTHAADLHDFYFSMRSKALIGSDEADDHGLSKFSTALSKFVKYRKFRQLATLNYTSDMYNMYSIVSSIEFDKDSDYFAIAGVTKKIKVYDYKQVVTDVVDIHYPITEMTCNSKISCIAWNPYHKNELTSSDYEGTVTIWDPFTSTKVQLFQEHEKRCWCVDYNKLNPHLMASGSDDSKVKIWSTRSSRSVLNIDAVANVCCVKFNPESSFHLAFGAADHCVHYYDLRNTSEPILTFRGHMKAVSYAKFLNGEEIVSASTDGQLKLWNVNEGTSPVRTFLGHTNEKNFVGLASESDYIACGSEDNSLCIYYKGLSQVLHKYKFEVVRSAWQRGENSRDEESNEFVSAVSWMPNSGVVVVANSQGIVKVLELI